MVRATLRAPHRNPQIAPELERAARLRRRLGIATAIATLARLLTDDALGLEAAMTMLALDRDRAAPLIFASMPHSDRNVQYQTFRRFIRLLRNRKRVCCRQAMHDAATRCLVADTNADAAELALYAIGLSGSQRDFPLLQRYTRIDRASTYWRNKLRAAATAALARLGSKPHVASIEGQLSQPIPADASADQARRIAAVIDQAAFVGNRRFIASLCRQLAHPGPAQFSDNIPPMPAEQAAKALAQIVDHLALDHAKGDVAAWRQRCKTLR